jgi:hypothetical protein
MLDNRYEQLFALSFINRIVEHKIANNIQDIFVYNKELWCTSSGGAMSTARPVRLGFTSSVNRIHFFNEFETIRFI